MKRLAYVMAAGVFIFGAHAGTARAQGTTVAVLEWKGPLGYRLRPAAPAIYCLPEDRAEVARLSINSALFSPGTMISPEQAKALALCAVPGQLAYGDVKARNGRIVYEVDVLPFEKRPYAKLYSTVEIDATNGEVINARQLGGLGGLAVILRESAARDHNRYP